MKPTTRRTILAASVTLPLLPIAAFASPNASLTKFLPTDPDPAVAAFAKWRAAFDAYERSWDRPHVPDDDPIMNVEIVQRRFEALKRSLDRKSGLIGFRSLP